jgi:hypothetical protein
MQTHYNGGPPSGPSLRIYTPPITPEPPEPEPSPPLAEFYAATVKPQLQREGRSRETFNEHARAIRRWQIYWGACETTGQPANHWTTCPVVESAGPPVREITAKMLADYRDWLADHAIPDARGQMRKTGSRSINKDLGYLSMILGRGAESGDTAGAVRARRIQRPQPGDPVEMPSEHIDAIFEACDVARWPLCDREGKPFGVPPALVWRFALVWFFNFGPRTEDLMPYTTDAAPLCWGSICNETENPHHNGRATCPGGWFFFVPYKTRRVKPQPLTLPINATARRWLDKLAEATPNRSHDRPLLYLPRSSKTFYDTWRAILKASGVAPKPILSVDAAGRPVRKSRQYLIKHLRSTAATAIENHAPGVGKLVTGHASDRSPDAAVEAKVFDQHYYHAEAAIVSALTTLPQPPAFNRLG